MNIDLTKYVIASGSWGPWLDEKGALTASELRLGDPKDGVTLAGPLRICIAIQARNQFTLFGSSNLALQTRDVYSYMLDIPPGQTWTYPAPAALGTGLQTNAGAAAVVSRETLWGANAGFGIAIRVAGIDLCDPCPPDPCRPYDSCRPYDPCAPRTQPCNCGGRCGGNCGCGCHQHPEQLPCDFATGRGGASTGYFFPAACEPCTPGAFVGMPPVKGPSLVVPAARGGTVRTRYFNGMFITKEDLWTDQNNTRLKHALMNRAMGQGVVWGLDVGLDSGAVVVCPGYGVDCCGNDVLISSMYRVDADALVRDPAAAAVLASGDSQRFNLLLEYYECPEEPRPVHGDGCAIDGASCEMSRIRETARLRLVPPCDVSDAGPIKDFLAQMQQLKGDPVTGPILSNAASAVTSTVVVQVPFTVLVEGLDSNGTVGSVTLDPKLTTDTPSVVSGDAKGVPNRSLMTRARVTINADAGFQLTAAGVAKQSPPGTVTPTTTTTSIMWEDDLPTAGASAPQLVYEVTAWRFQTSGGSLSSDGTVIKLTVQPSDGLRMQLHVEIEPSAVTASTTPPPFPCSSEACDPEGRPRFPVPIPWLHEDPAKPGDAADPKVLALALLDALMVSRIAQTGPATTPATQAQIQTLGNAVNLAAWRLFYGDAAAGTQASLLDALRRLFQAWCKALLYPGPTCECGCDPHGVVIGCAVVAGGRLQMVDPWGGRRWVVHYPLLAYWGRLFGIQPLDAIASKLFDLICCIAQLVPPGIGGQQVTGPGSQRLVGVRAPIVSFGASALVLDQPANIADRLREIGVTADRRVAIGTVEFITRVVQALNSPAAAAAPTTRTVLYTVNGLPELNFVVPDPDAGSTGAATPASTPAPASGASAPGRLATTVHAVVAARSARTAVPLLLRDTTEVLTRDLLSAIAPEPATDEGRAARDVLASAGINSVAQVLDADPERLLAHELQGRNAQGLADLLDVGEKSVTATAKAVGDTMVQFAGDRRIVSRDDLRRRDTAAQFDKALTTALKGTVPADYVTAAVRRIGNPAHRG